MTQADYKCQLAQCRHDAQVLRSKLAQARSENPSRVFPSRRVQLLEEMLDQAETEARRYERLLREEESP